MKKYTVYSESIKVDDEDWTVSLIPTGKGVKTVYYAYLFDACGHAKKMMGFPVDQRQATIDPHVYDPEEIMDMALDCVEDFIGDLYRINRFETLLEEHFIETDCIRAKNTEIYNNASTDSCEEEE